MLIFGRLGRKRAEIIHSLQPVPFQTHRRKREVARRRHDLSTLGSIKQPAGSHCGTLQNLDHKRLYQ